MKIKDQEWVSVFEMRGVVVKSEHTARYQAWVYYLNGEIALQLREDSYTTPPKYAAYVFTKYRHLPLSSTYSHEKLVATNLEDAKREAEALLMAYQLGDRR